MSPGLGGEPGTPGKKKPRGSTDRTYKHTEGQFQGPCRSEAVLLTRLYIAMQLRNWPVHCKRFTSFCIPHLTGIMCGMLAGNQL